MRMHSSVSIQRADVDMHLGVLRGMPSHKSKRQSQERARLTVPLVHAFHSAFTLQENRQRRRHHPRTPYARRTLDSSFSSFIAEVFAKRSPNG